MLKRVSALSQQVRAPLLAFSAAATIRAGAGSCPARRIVDADGDHAVGRKVAEFLEGAPNLNKDQSKLLEQILTQHPRPN